MSWFYVPKIVKVDPKIVEETLRERLKREKRRKYLMIVDRKS